MPTQGTDETISIGNLAARTGVAVSALRFYEERGLVRPVRDGGGRRRFRRSDVRRVSFVIAAQRLGFALSEIEAQLAALPNGRTPTVRDWERIAAGFRADINERIDRLVDLRDRLASCIGCGCLSLKKCALYNPQDAAGEKGPGPRFLLGERGMPAGEGDP
ncbi:MAG: redox-sensitive transcriptional activator SoxR [Alphaproteobacteria bacterium]|nr:redox-sensitive transcriptional activator SoxR [Alphaproteobacteria bacterium]